MPRLEWKYGFVTHNKIVDLQHKYFVELINRLYDELEQSREQQYQKRLLDELSHYARFHFTSEENIFLKHYPEKFAKHKILHDTLLVDLTKHIDDFNNNKLAAHDILHFVMKWFATHTITEDVQDFIK
jgi:hemerythrin